MMLPATEQPCGHSTPLRGLPREWRVAPRAPQPTLDALSAATGLHPLIVQLLLNRGLGTAEQIQRFLADGAGTGRGGANLHDPFLMKDMDRAAERVKQALDRRELIAIYGDFDVDGVSGVVLLQQALTALGGRAIPYIPHRDEEGYGLNCPALTALAEQGVNLVITTDCGISSLEEVEHCRCCGVDIIITDHHHICENGLLPQALAVVNPKRPDCSYPFKYLAGVGVAFKLIQAVLKLLDGTRAGSTFPTILERELLDLVALGTVADLAPLLDENRTLVSYGMSALNRTNRPGIHELIQRAGLQYGSVECGRIGYALAPRLNAAGRLDHAITSYQLLLTTDPEEASRLASQLDEINQQRQRLTQEVYRRVEDDLRAMLDVSEDGAVRSLPNLLFFSDEAYPSGVLGLVAGRIAEKFCRPTIIIEGGNAECRGSARSIPGFNIVAALDECQDILVKYGGHAQAAGFTVAAVKIEELQRRLSALAAEALTTNPPHAVLDIDANVRLTTLNWDVYKAIQRLAPFGQQNQQPVFLSRNIVVREVQVVGRECPRHLRLRLFDGKQHWVAMAFCREDLAPALSAAKTIDLVYTLEANHWNGATLLELNIKDVCVRS